MMSSKFIDYNNIEYKSGDLIFFWGNDNLSRLISWITWGPSHVAIIVKYNNQLLLAESTTLYNKPCVAQEKIVSGVQLHHIAERIEDYKNGKIQHCPLSGDCSLTNIQCDTLENIITDNLGVIYDSKMAILSATPFLKMLPYPDKSSLFCSAFVARTYQIINRMNWSNPEIYSPAGLRRSLLWSATIERGQVFYP